MCERLKELYKYRELLYMIAYRDIRVRYKQSIMGFLWAILMPILIVMSGIVVRIAYARAAHTSLEPADIASLAVKSLPWAFFVSSTRFGCNSLAMSNRELVTKVYFPKEIFPLGAVAASFFDLAVATIALVVFLAVEQIKLNLNLLWVPVLLLTLIAISCGVSMLVAAGSLFFRDVKYIVEVFLTFGIFFTPVFYSIQMVGSRGKWLLLNPLAPVLEGLSLCIARQTTPDLIWVGYSMACAIAVLTAGYLLFKHLEPAFAESI